MRTDDGAPATCFTSLRNVTPAEAEGACRAAPIVGGAGDGGTTASAADDGCLPVPLMCSGDAAAAPASPVDVADGGAAADASPDESTPTDGDDEEVER
jgi:hypothetical protein